MSGSGLQQLAREQWLVNRLGQHGARVFAGLTDCETRRERIREAILRNGLAEVIVGRKDGKPRTYAEVFSVIFGEPLSRA